jgi:manganese/zinc/iron transport system substrate-binding protein
MKKRICFFALIALIGAFLFVLFSDTGRENATKHITIVTTTSMLADAVRIIAGDQMIVHCLMGCGIDPHVYRARESDVHKLAAADLVVFNGLHLEGKMGQVLQGMDRFTKIVNASDAIAHQKLRTAEFEELYDPHIWFDVTLWICVVRYIQEKIIELDPVYAALYQKNGDEYITQLEQLHAYVQQRVNEINSVQRILITAHDAFGYFGEAYGFEVVGLQGLSTDSDISTKDVQQLANYIVQKKIPTIFVEASIAARSMRAVQEAVAAQGWRVVIGEELYSDALGDEESGADSYMSMVKHNVDVIVDALK